MALPKIIYVTAEKHYAKEALAVLGKAFEVTVATTAKDGFLKLSKDQGARVVISDLRLPDVDGITFLAKVRSDFPKVVRILASGDEDFKALTGAVNLAHVYTILPRPCDPKVLRKAVVEAVKLYGKVRPDADALRDTMFGTVRMLVDILDLTHPVAVRRSKRIRRRARKVSEEVNAMTPQFMDMVVLLSNIGCVGLPAGLLKKIEKGASVSKEEQQIFLTHPSIAAHLLENIPRMGKIANVIRHQNTPCSEKPPLGARVLKACIDLDHLQIKGMSADKGIEYMRGKPDVYDVKVVDALGKHLGDSGKTVCNEISVAELKPGMVMQADMVTESGTVLLQKGDVLSDSSYQRINAFSDLLHIKEPVCAVMPD